MTLATSSQYEVSNNPFGDNGEDDQGVTHNNYQAINLTPFKGVISQCFEPHLHIYIEAQDRNLAEMVERFASEAASGGVGASRGPEGSPVLPSCGDLFVFYRKCLVQCSELSTGQPMLSLSTLFRKYLSEYTRRVLVPSLPRVGSASATQPLPSIPSMTQLRDLKELSQATTGILANFSSLLKEGGDSVRFSPADQEVICMVLVTVEYCIDTTKQLEEKLKQKVETALADQITFAGELEMFHSVTAQCVGLLVNELEGACDPALQAMVRVAWAAVEQVGDQSHYVSQLSSAVRATVPRLRDCLQTSRKYFTQFCLKFVTSFIPKFISQLYRCRPVGTVGAEQLLLDTHSLKTVLLDLPNLAEASGQQNRAAATRKAPAAFTKVVVKGMTRAEMILKVVMSPADPLDGFVEQYIRLVQDPDLAELGKLLEMKGLRRGDQTAYLERFRETFDEGGIAGEVPGSPAQGGSEQSRIRKLEKLIKKRL